MLTDDEILNAVRYGGQHGKLTAYIASVARFQTKKPVDTAWMLRQLKRLEKDGKVRRTPTGYQTQIAWAEVRRPPPPRAS